VRATVVVFAIAGMAKWAPLEEGLEQRGRRTATRKCLVVGEH